ncbi:MAG: hypothetical protein ACUVR2_03750 [Anaerolineae bacterium]
MRRNPERLAWTVLWIAFALFCTLTVSIPLGMRWYLTNATRAYEAKVTCLEGTAVVEDPRYGTAKPVLKGETLSVPEGTVVSVDETAQAVVTFFDQSFVRLFPRSSIALERMRMPRFSTSPRSAQIIVYAKGGRLWTNTVLRGSSPVEFRVESLQAHTLLAEDGGYAMEVSNERTEVIVHRGMAEVTATSLATPIDTAKVTLSARQRTVVEIGKAPLAPLKAERDLLINSDFTAPLGTGWTAFNDQGGDGGEVDGTVALVVDEGRRAVRFYRIGGEYNHCETIIEQELNRDLPDPLTTLKVRATIKLVHQSLSGGGYLSSEYPLMIRIRYRDVYLSENEWIRGFYYQNDNNNPTMNGQEIPQNKWYFYESENLLDVLPVAPRRILWIRVYASGWSYESLISQISLIVE